MQIWQHISQLSSKFKKTLIDLILGISPSSLSHIRMIKSDRKYIYNVTKDFCIIISGGPLSALTCCVNARLLSAIKKISPLIYSQSWVGSWVYTTHYDDFHPDILARMYT